MEKRPFSITGIFKLSRSFFLAKKVLSYPWLEVLLSFEAVKKKLFPQEVWLRIKNVSF
jgi:hypothetical protein